MLNDQSSSKTCNSEKKVASNPRKGIGGPKTPEGKIRSSLNALKHGLTAKSPQAIELIYGESQARQQEILCNLMRRYHPTYYLQEELVAKMWKYAKNCDYAEMMLKRLSNMRHKSKYLSARIKLEQRIRMQRIHFNRADAAFKETKNMRWKKRA